MSPVGNVSFPALVCAAVVSFNPLSAFAAAHFLPDYEDHLASFQNTKLDFNNVNTQQCKDFELNKCPDFAVCNRCAFENKFLISSCFEGYKINTDKTSCLPKPCADINASYSSAIAADNNCAFHKFAGFSCYSSCRAVNCASYTISSCPQNAVCISCPDCEETAGRTGNCSSSKLKVASCKSSTQKVNDNATACIDKDDTCPSGYFKKCDSGIDGNYNSSFTELGSECFRCKARTCSSGGLNLDYYFCNGFLKCLIPAK